MLPIAYLIEQADALECTKPRPPRPTSSVVCELAYERKEVSDLLAKFNKAIAADPEAVSAHHKELWRKQAKVMQEYVDILGARIKDLIDNG